MEHDERSNSDIGKREQVMYCGYLTIAGANRVAAESDEKPGDIIGQSNTLKGNTNVDKNKD